MPGQNQLMKRVLIGLTLLAAIQTPEVLGLDGADAVLTNLGMSRCARERGWLTKQGEKEFASQLLATGQSLGQLTIADFEELMKLQDLSRQINKAIADAGGSAAISDAILPAVMKTRASSIATPTPGANDQRCKSRCALLTGWTGERGKEARRRWKCI